jgi:hypothetical protein
MTNEELITAILNHSGHPLDLQRMFAGTDAQELVNQVGQSLAGTALVYWLEDIQEAVTDLDSIRSSLPQWALEHIESSNDPETVEGAAATIESACCCTSWAALGDSRFIEEVSSDPEDGSAVECWSDGVISITGQLSEDIHRCAHEDGVSPSEWVRRKLPLPQPA